MSLAPFVLALFPTPVAAAPDELLPETPEGWRYERLEFPLSFAPELDYEGFEELRFAPGMFVADSDSYFSYTLAIRLEGDHRVDRELVAGFLASYYRGLATPPDGPPPDEEAFAVDVVAHPAGFLATVDTIDTFVTGEPLRLRFELSVREGPGHVELLGIVSPLEEEAPIWDELHAIQERWLSAKRVPVFLNHLYVVPDLETYDAIASSDALRELIVVEERTTVRRDLTYTGVYLYGRDTYFEFLKPSGAFPEGSSGVAFGVEVPARRNASRSGSARAASRAWCATCRGSSTESRCPGSGCWGCPERTRARACLSSCSSTSPSSCARGTPTSRPSRPASGARASWSATRTAWGWASCTRGP